jgi:hypothetical protein
MVEIDDWSEWVRNALTGELTAFIGGLDWAATVV